MSHQDVEQVDSTIPTIKTRVRATRYGAKGTVRFIQDRFRNDGFDLVQVDRNKDVAVYLKTKGEYTGYETVIIRVVPIHPMDKDAVSFQLVERYPSSEEWGLYGFTYATLEEAETKSKNLQKGKRQCQTQ